MCITNKFRKREDVNDRYGYCELERTVGVNLNKLWDDTLGKNLKRKEKNFINNYCKILNHEYLHYCIAYILFTFFEDKEELLVDKISCSDKIKVLKNSMCVEFEEIEDIDV